MITFKQILKEELDISNLTSKDIFDVLANRYPYPGYKNPMYNYDSNLTPFFKSKEQAEICANKLINLFNSFPNPIPIYRIINVDSLEDINLDLHSIGICWSFSPDIEYNFGGGIKKFRILLSAFIDKEDVDWDMTIIRFFMYSFDINDSEYNENGENEIRVKNTHNIMDVSMKVVDERD